MPEATADDVRVEIDTGLSDAEIEGDSNDPDDDGIIGRVERDWKREYDSGDFDDTQHIQDFEATLTALRIAEGRDRRAESEDRESASIDYETNEVENLRQRVRLLDPGDAFGLGTVTRDTNRHVDSTRD